MPSEILIKRGTPIVWADTTDYSATVSGYTRTAQIDLTEILFGEARQGHAVDLGTTKPLSWTVKVGLEFKTGEAPESGETCEIFFASSGAASSGFPGGVSGSDADYTGTAADSLVDSLAQLTGPFVFVLTADVTGTIQHQVVGTLYADEVDRYIAPVFLNNTDAEDLHTDAVEMYIALIPNVPESQ